MAAVENSEDTTPIEVMLRGPEDRENKDAQDLKDIRKYLHQAAEIRDPTAMWYAVRDIMNLLTLMVGTYPEG